LKFTDIKNLRIYEYRFMEVYCSIKEEYRRVLNSPTLSDKFDRLCNELDKIEEIKQRCDLLHLDFCPESHYAIYNICKNYLDDYNEYKGQFI